MGKACTFLIVLLSLLRPQVRAQQIPVNDTMYMVRLAEVDITDERKWANDTARYRYNQMRYYVKTILPYLDAATVLFSDINTKMNTPGFEGKQRREFIKAKETEMRTRFEDKVNALNVTQGVLLIKLIARQTGTNIYSVISDFKNPFVAIKWQTWARLNGHNLNKKYDPAAEPDLEQIMRGLGYPLPAYYKSADEATAFKDGR